MMENNHICVIEDSEIQLFKLKAILVRLGYSVTTYTSPISALEWLEKNSATVNLIMSDVIMPEMNGYDFVRKLKANPATAQIPILMLTAATEVKDKIEGLQAGADEFLPKTVTPTELGLRIKALISRKDTNAGTIAQSGCKTISVFSLRGGVGKTSLAVNLSIALLQVFGSEVVLWDMALLAGHCALMLDLKARNTLASLSDWDEDVVEDKIAAGMLVNHGSGIKLLPAPLKPADAELITRKTVNLIWPYLQKNFAYIVVDAGSSFTDAALTILEGSDAILLVLSPELASVKSALDAIRIFEEMGLGSGKVLPVVNDIFPSYQMQMSKISQILGNRKVFEIPYNSSAMIESINYGRPVIMTSPKNEIAEAVFALAARFGSKSLFPNPIQQRA